MKDEKGSEGCWRETRIRGSNSQLWSGGGTVIRRKPPALHPDEEEGTKSSGTYKRRANYSLRRALSQRLKVLKGGFLLGRGEGSFLLVSYGDAMAHEA